MASNFINIAGNIIAPFPLESVTTKEFGWLPPASWTAEDGKYWVNHRYSHLHNAIQPPPFVLEKYKKIGMTRGIWLLKSEGRALAWAEIHCFQSAFTKSFLFFETTGEVHHEQVSLLISAVMINSESDVLYLCAAGTQKAQALVDGLTTIESNTWWLPNAHALRETDANGQTITVKKIIPATWWQLDQSQADRTALAYLVKRRDFEKARDQRRAAAKKRPRFRGLLGLFSPRR